MNILFFITNNSTVFINCENLIALFTRERHHVIRCTLSSALFTQTLVSVQYPHNVNTIKCRVPSQCKGTKD